MIAPQRGGQGQDGHKEEDRRDDRFPGESTQGFWRKQNSTTCGSVYLREIGDLCGSEFIMWICLRGSEFYLWICSGSGTKSVTHLNPSPFSHSHFPPPPKYVECSILEYVVC